MMLLDLSRHTVRTGWAAYAGSVVALFFGVALIGLTVEMMTAVSEYRATLGPGDSETRTQLDDLTSMLGVMSGFSGFIAIFVVASTFSFVVSSRRRELGLLRLIGATPRQVRRMILGESIIVATVASLAGCVFAHLIAPGVLWLAHSQGITPMRLDGPSFWPTLAIAFPIGVVVALLGARAASRRASRITPIDAMLESAVDRRRLGVGRIVIGVLFLAGAIAMLVTMGEVTGEIVLVLGIFAPEMMVIALVCLGPVLFPALARLIAWPLLAAGDVSIRTARDNVAAAGKRTASLAAPTLAISAIAGSLILTLALAADYDVATNRQLLAAPVVVQGGGSDASDILQHSDAVRVADASASTEIKLIDQDGVRDPATVETIDASNAATARGLRADEGSLDALHGRTIAMSRTFTFDSGYDLGDKVTVAFKGQEPMVLRLVAIVNDAPSLHGDLLVPPALSRTEPDRWFVVPQPGLGDPVAALTAELRGTSAQVTSASSWIAAIDAEMRRNNTFSLWVVLGPAGFYAALAIANTLLMGSLQRKREFIAIRLIGATGRQVRRIVLWESTLVTLASLALGAVTATVVALLIGRSLSAGLDSMPVDVPWTNLGLIGGLCLVIAVVAAVAPTSSMLRRVHPSQAAE
jgi:putative ABC transport system permease protein